MVKEIHAILVKMNISAEGVQTDTIRDAGLPCEQLDPAVTVNLNDERRAFGAKEYEAFKQRHAQPE
jgi:hypothetical protein